MLTFALTLSFYINLNVRFQITYPRSLLHMITQIRHRTYSDLQQIKIRFEAICLELKLTRMHTQRHMDEFLDYISHQVYEQNLRPSKRERESDFLVWSAG